MFIDSPLSRRVPGLPCISVPMTRTSITVTSGGRERRNQEWEHPLHRFILPEAAGRHWDVIEALKAHWMVMRGPLHSFPFRDPLDFASRDLVKPNLVPTVAATDQLIGVTDGFTDRFQLKKRYLAGTEYYDRQILLPDVASVVVAVDGVTIDPGEYSVSRQGGEVLFGEPPTPAGRNVTAGFLFDVEVRFESDDQMETILRATKAGGFGDITLVEVRPC